ncbi:hypothetical protein T440DRAFT_234264 [Plenodomus tracheiphilus IPT5]|uniref:Uncharacterized protein n=1 Tax=Plenodomus tracheiphilus IPT5 TaxID=1408161 RepID=A0A6A7BG18_9PLEO|nr:hypothetical protein T440DRAFT_234264 [Plenodomus tracheiphilus IPT5]
MPGSSRFVDFYSCPCFVLSRTLFLLMSDVLRAPSGTCLIRRFRHQHILRRFNSAYDGPHTESAMALMVRSVFVGFVLDSLCYPSTLHRQWPCISPYPNLPFFRYLASLLPDPRPCEQSGGRPPHLPLSNTIRLFLISHHPFNAFAALSLRANTSTSASWAMLMASLIPKFQPFFHIQDSPFSLFTPLWPHLSNITSPGSTPMAGRILPSPLWQ